MHCGVSLHDCGLSVYVTLEFYVGKHEVCLQIEMGHVPAHHPASQHLSTLFFSPCLYPEPVLQPSLNFIKCSLVNLLSLSGCGGACACARARVCALFSCLYQPLSPL